MRRKMNGTGMGGGIGGATRFKSSKQQPQQDAATRRYGIHSCFRASRGFLLMFVMILAYVSYRETSLLEKSIFDMLDGEVPSSRDDDVVTVPTVAERYPTDVISTTSTTATSSNLLNKNEDLYVNVLKPALDNERAAKAAKNVFRRNGSKDYGTMKNKKQQSPKSQQQQQQQEKTSVVDSEKLSLSWTEEELKVCKPNMKPLNLTWWNDIVVERQEQYRKIVLEGRSMTSTMHPPPPPPRPIWLPGFPGSGNEMVGQLVQALTGGLGGRDIYKSGEDRACVPSITATCKTHWPVIARVRADPRGNATGLYGSSSSSSSSTNTSIALPWSTKVEFSSSYIVLLRNPMNAIPSYVNFRYEKKNGLAGHTTQASKAYWNAQRDMYLIGFVRKWTQLVKDWQSYEQPPINLHRAMFLSYEQLTNVQYGPVLTMQLAQVIRDAGYEDIVAANEDIPCLWYHVVKSRSLSGQLSSNFRDRNKQATKRNQENEKAAGTGTTSTTMRGPSKYVPGYTIEQKQHMMKALRGLKRKYSDYLRENKENEESRQQQPQRQEKEGSNNNDYDYYHEKNVQQSMELIKILDGYLRHINRTMHII